MLQSLYTLTYRIVLLLYVTVMVSCALGVKPYEREFLADPVMQLNDDVDATKMEEHLLQNREGSSGGESASGGGCGC